MTGNSSFDASPSALGYIYQVRYALLLALQKIDKVEDPDDCLVSIEKIDDISFHSEGSPHELLQSKYHSSHGNLSDRSPDIWKTIRVWSEHLTSISDTEDVTFTLITTETVAEDSLASWLSPDEAVRNVDAALAIMRDISAETSNATNKSSYQAFQELSLTQQRKLVSSIFVLENAETIGGVRQSLKKKLRTTVEHQQIEPFLVRLEGAWFKRAIDILASSKFAAISLGELVSIIDDLRSQFLPGNLPADFDNALPDVIDIQGDHRIFVEQLRLINAPNRAIKLAIINYYRAYEQRSRWLRENLLKPGEDGKYLARLRQEWDHHYSLYEMKANSSKESDLAQLGRDIYASCQNEGAQPIRRDFQAPYVARGSYHHLADKQIIGWHPDYEEQLNQDPTGVA
ncbi:hypothetical protein CF392_02780 [Tamilnaduibacter salinus]|uniref:ABC-three component systems C-terminal domain-containing protein n=1 Tax=Tamilnaduibacter salinus TaxID=1484056 RepID=A0A2A2I6Z9_9GAMM|nr:ABC-three component system protein [Tamilnaduibacter salinus]PAV27076.1 hypothetical protein CF392_02780 [Tamilnaduibacter salinus]